MGYIMKLPVYYENLTREERREVRKHYVLIQKNRCFFCNGLLHLDPPKEITDKPINLKLFPENFLKYPIHLQHDHCTGLTEGAVHAYCNAVLWEYYDR
jgi:hypothetical protein